MNCPVCNRTLAPTLSICLTCGAMMNDSVREELQTKIGSAPPLKIEKKEQRKPKQVSQPLSVSPTRIELPLIKKPAPAAKAVTAELAVQHTSPTLVDFQAKNAALPDWRLQLQNAIRKRKDYPVAQATEPKAVSQTRLVTNGANALKSEVVQAPQPEQKVEHANPRVASALKRISDSRKTFLPQDAPAKPQKSGKPSANRQFPFNVVSRNEAPAIEAKRPPSKASVNVPPKPRLVSALRIEKKDFDTNKLPPIEDVIKPIAAPEEIKIVAPKQEIQAVANENLIHIADAEPTIFSDTLSDEIEDLAPMSMRFNAGLFDLLIGSFASFILLSPVIFTGGDWFSPAGVLAFVATCAIVMFIYLTTAIGMYGKTIGMRMFSLELIDAEENEYPTFHQAAVSSAVYLLLMPLVGVSFLPAFFNEEQRAAHDLASGTMIVTEF